MHFDAVALSHTRTFTHAPTHVHTLARAFTLRRRSVNFAVPFYGTEREHNETANATGIRERKFLSLSTEMKFSSRASITFPLKKKKKSEKSKGKKEFTADTRCEIRRYPTRRESRAQTSADMFSLEREHYYRNRANDYTARILIGEIAALCQSMQLRIKLPFLLNKPQARSAHVYLAAGGCASAPLRTFH